MKRSPIVLSALGLAVAGTLAVAAPAAAAPYPEYEEIQAGNFSWFLSTGDDGGAFGIDEAESYSSDGVYIAGDAFDSTGFSIYVGDADFIDLYCALPDLAVDAATGDQIVSCAPQSYEGLDYTTDIRVFSAGDLARYVVTLTNATDAPITYDYDYFADLGDGGTFSSSSGDAVATADDNWAVNTDDTDLPSGLAWAATGAPARPNIVANNDEDYDVINVGDIGLGARAAVAPGTTTTLAFFHKLSSAPVIDEAAYAALTASMTEFDSFAGRLVNGLAAGTIVANWGTVPAAVVPVVPAPAVVPAAAVAPAATLAATGADASAPLGAAALLLLAGTAAVATRRRAVSN